MVFINRSTRELHAKVVYVGPPSSGKSTNLRVIAERTDKNHVGEMISLDRDRDRTAYFDFLPMTLGRIRGYTCRMHLYSIPGRMPFRSSRRMIIKGVDAMVFVADSDPARVQENLQSLKVTQDAMIKFGVDPDTTPLIFQFNKRDLPHAVAQEELAALLETDGHLVFPSVALTGEGVFDTLRAVSRIVLDRLIGEQK